MIDMIDYLIDKARKPIYNQSLIIGVMRVLKSRNLLTNGEFQKIIADAVAMTKEFYEEEEKKTKNPRAVRTPSAAAGELGT